MNTIVNPKSSCGLRSPEHSTTGATGLTAGTEHQRSHRSIRRAGKPSWVELIGLAVLTSLVVTSCSGGPVGSLAAKVNSVGPASSTATAPQPLVRPIGKTAWWDGFAVTVDDATLTRNGFGSDSLTLHVTYQNLTQHNATPAAGALQVGGAVVNAESDPPTVPGSGTAKATITAAALPASADFAGELDSAALTFGAAADNQSKIPLATAGTVDSIEPKTLNVTGKLVQGQIAVDVLGGTLAPSYQAGEKGQMTVDLRVRLTCSTQCSTAGNYVNEGAFSLTAPGGSAVVADPRSPYRRVSLDPGEVNNDSQNVLVFLVPAPGTGSYALSYDAKLADGATPPAALQFTA